MPTSWSGVVASLCLLASCAVACSSSSSSGAAADGPSGSIGADGGASRASVQVRFVDDTLTFLPGDVRTVAVQVDPPGTYTVRFALVGDSRDAFLDASETTTSESGAAAIHLTAPSSPATFSLRASVGTVSATLSASAGKKFTTLNVVPLYAGHRTITSWVATVQTGSHCDAKDGVPPPDGSLRGESGASESPRVDGVPASTSLTVTLRAGHFAGGCAELESVAADRPTTVSVTVIDRPLQLGAIAVPVALGIDGTDTWTHAWDDLSTGIAKAFVSGATNDATALLDAMMLSTPRSSRGAFLAQRVLLGWDVTLGEALSASLGDAPLRSIVKRWVGSGAASLSSEAFAGTLVAPETPSGSATLEIASIGGNAPVAVGFVTTSGKSTIDVSWASASDDRILFGGAASWNPVLLATALAVDAATAEVPSATTVPEALADALSCAAVAKTLVGPSTVAFGTCDSDCVVSRCELALRAMWDAARSAGPHAAQLDFAASAGAALDDEAKPVAFTGRWVGTARLGLAPVRVRGAALGGTAVKSAR